MKKINLGLLIVLLITGALFAGGAKDESDGSISEQEPIAEENPTSLKLKNINFEDEPDGNLKLNNLTDFDAVVFAGKVEEERVLGGIRAGQARSFDFSRISDIPSQGALLVRIASYDTYNNKAHITEADVLWTGLVVYDLNNEDDKQDINIYKGMDEKQKNFIYVSNKSKFVLELRLGSPTGERLTTIAPNVSNKKIWVDPPADGLWLELWPTYMHVDSKNSITPFVMDNENESEWMTPTTDTGSFHIAEFKGPGEGDSIAFKMAFVRLFNGTPKGIAFYNSQSVLSPQNGIKLVNPGKSNVFEIDSLNGVGGQTYDSLKYSTPGHEVLIDEYTFIPGIEYEIRATAKNGILEYVISESGKRSISSSSQVLVFE